MSKKKSPVKFSKEYIKKAKVAGINSTYIPKKWKKLFSKT